MGLWMKMKKKEDNNMTLSQKWILINKFITFKLKQRPNCKVIKQSMPKMGVWIDDSFYSIDQLVAALNNK